MFKTIVSVFTPKGSLESSRSELIKVAKSFKSKNVPTLGEVVPIVSVAKPQNLVLVTFATADKDVTYLKLKRIASLFEKESILCSEQKY